MQPVISCPQPSCGLSAQIVDRWIWDSTDGPVEHVKTCCPNDHWFTPALETLTIHPTTNRSPEPGTVVAVG
jgi:hypothetical protein